jgi:hypothetical protein
MDPRTLPVQNELREHHPQRELLDRIEALITERIIDTFGTFASEKWLNTFQKELEHHPTTVAKQVAEAVAKGVAGTLAGNSEFPTGTLPAARPNEIVLIPSQVRSISKALWYQNAAQFAQLRYELQWFPGWQYMWVFTRLRALNAIVHDPKVTHNAMNVRPDLAFAVLHRDGSGEVHLNDGTVIHTETTTETEPLPALRTRDGEIDESYGHYMTVDQLRAKIAENKATENTRPATPAQRKRFCRRKDK